MVNPYMHPHLETKFHTFSEQEMSADGAEISGYASLFGAKDQGGDIVRPGAFKASLAKLKAQNRKVKMLWQHDCSQPIGVWSEVREDKRGLFVRGRILENVQAGAEALALIKAGAIDGLSIGFRTMCAEPSNSGQRVLHELDLWEVSLVTFPMLTEARASVDGPEASKLAHELVRAISAAREELRT